MQNKLILKVKQELCRGCGLCEESCPQQAISLQSGTAQIDQNRCNQCCLCVDVCFQGAISALTPVSRSELQTAVSDLKERAENIIDRIKILKEK